MSGHSPRVRGNDWGVLDAPDLGFWEPRKSVSIVIPAYHAQDTLPYTLAALDAQSYPAHLIEVVVVDDGDGDPLVLPELRPESTRVVRPTRSWGRANACKTGAAVAEGEIIHWLDADMVPERHQVEAQLRWHHVIDHAVVLGRKTFVDPTDMPPTGEVHEAVDADKLDALLSGRWTDEHQWVETIWRRTFDLTRAGFRAFHVHVGATASVSKAFYREAGEMDGELKLGEDVELGYRLAMKGGVFVADRDARSWHLGRTHLMRHEQQVQRYNAPFTAERVPDFRKFRQDRGRTYRVPMIEVVVHTDGHTYEDVKYTVDGVLQAVPNDVRCVLVGNWSILDDQRRSPLQDPHLDLRLLREEYASEARVTFAGALEPSAFPVLFRLHLPTGWRPGPTTMDDMAKDMQVRSLGLRSALLPDGRVARLERTAAFERARRVIRKGEDIDDVVDAVSKTWWSEGVEDGFLHAQHAPHPAGPPGGGSRTKDTAGPRSATPDRREPWSPGQRRRVRNYVRRILPSRRHDRT